MAVEFEICMFSPEYAENIRKKELKRHPFLKPEDVRVEKGDIFCFNTARRSAIPFYELDEVITLIDAAFFQANRVGSLEPEEVELEELPADMVEKLRVIVDDLFKGRVKTKAGTEEFHDERELRRLIEANILIK